MLLKGDDVVDLNYHNARQAENILEIVRKAIETTGEEIGEKEGLEESGIITRVERAYNIT